MYTKLHDWIEFLQVRSEVFEVFQSLSGVICWIFLGSHSHGFLWSQIHISRDLFVVFIIIVNGIVLLLHFSPLEMKVEYPCYRHNIFSASPVSWRNLRSLVQNLFFELFFVRYRLCNRFNVTSGHHYNMNNI